MKPYTEMYRRWITVPGVQAADIAVLSALYAHADRDGVCTATQGELAEELRQSRAWINAILKALQDTPVALVAARTRRGYRGYLYELTGFVDTSCQPADSGGPRADVLLGTGNPLNPESSSFREEGDGALPVDWSPSPEDRAWAASERPEVDPARVTAKFVAWCRKAHGRNGYRPADPGAAWRRWIARELVAPAAIPTAAETTGQPRAVPFPPSPRREVRHDRRFQRPSAEPSSPGRGAEPAGSGPVGSGLAARNGSTLAALRDRLARPA
ncbi:MarR family transcriptional regulator [Azospirillum doebereinerae]|uniref:MarR family transcriptional regulator n=1 Tax=Azospirillum doebereinerae TaxID=92933 RepID=UPI001EE624A3|nr:MarR family transcriptional regulator [Azospirillum doebereinerae]MCG5243927.1 MarR family transcriptional regulator [Azospirillum doebereinerae]